MTRIKNWFRSTEWNWLPLAVGGCGLGATLFLCRSLILQQRLQHTGNTAITFWVGVLISVLLYFNVQLAQTARRRTKAVEWANAQLETQVAASKALGEALRQTNQRLQAVIQASPLAIIAVDLEGKVRSWNPAAETIFGWGAEEVTGQSLPILDGEDLARALGGEMTAGLERRHKRKDGPPADVAIWSAPLRDAAGKVNGLVTAIADISERRKLEQQLLQSQKMEAIGRLAGGVAHDFNNLLTIINGYSHLALSGLPADDPVRGQIEEIVKAGNRAASLTTQLLAFSRRQMIQPKPLDLNHVVTNIERMLCRVIGEHIEFKTVLGVDIGKVKADANQIEQALINLAVNARDAMPRGGTLTIDTSAVTLGARAARQIGEIPPGAYVLLRVTDTGHGMDGETKQHIFEPFYSTKKAGKGTGLGLSSVYGSVQQHKGAITVWSEPGKGARFSIYLPRLAEDSPVEIAEAAAPATSRGTETILVAEDEPALRRMVCEVLSQAGYQVLEAGDGTEAARYVEEQGRKIDLLLTDVVMPLMNGHQLADRLKAALPALRVIYMSGHTDDVIAYHGVLDSKTVLIQKPFPPDVLAAKVRSVLDSGKSRTAGK
jgi:two-component system, cell cycle sensor histidine kinase and response regulator CckA